MSNMENIDLDTEDLLEQELEVEELLSVEEPLFSDSKKPISNEELDSYNKYLDKNKKFLASKAYPNVDYQHIANPHDMDKWLKTVKSIFFRVKNGEDKYTVMKQIISDWKKPEAFDFLNWLKFYESGSHMKYKYAQSYYVNNNSPGYFVPIEKHIEDFNSAKDADPDELPSVEKKRLIEKQRNKIITRLDSAEKLLRSNEGQLFSGTDFEALLEAIYSLKKKVQLINKVSTSTKMYEDMIICQANILHRNGFVKGSEFLNVFAQVTAPDPKATVTPEPPKPAEPPKPPKTPEAPKAPETPPTTPAIEPAPVAAPAAPSGAPGSIPSVGPEAPPNPPDSPNANAPVAISKFLDNLKTNKITTDKDTMKSDDLEVFDVDDTLEVDDFIVEAQALPPAPSAPPITPEVIKDDPTPVALPETPIPANVPKEKPLEVTENDIKAPVEVTPTVSDMDSKINALFSGVTMADVISKLEDLAKIYKTREVPRQLGIVDIMLDSLGLAAYFPSLSEATNKALESNNYISTRIEEILSKLRGTVHTNEIDLLGDDTVKPEMEGIKNKLENDENAEKERKQLRKEKENVQLEVKDTSDIDVTEGLEPEPVPTTPVVPPAPIK